MILFRPQATVDRLLEERKTGQSWGATWFLVGINLLCLAVVGIFFSIKFNELFEMADQVALEPLDLTVLYVSMGIIGVFALVGIVLTYVLARFFFEWLVVLGLRMVAANEYPTDPAERLEKRRLLALIQPYTAWIYVLASVLTLPLIPLFFDLSSFIDLVEQSEMGLLSDDEIGADFAMIIIKLIIWSAATQLLSLALFVYMIIVRVLAIKKIYNISAVKAFFGPFITYVILYFILFALYLFFVIVVGVVSDPLLLDPRMV